MTAVQVVDSDAFEEFKGMYKAVVEVAITKARENVALKEKLLLSAQEVAEMTGFSERFIRDKKNDIGFVPFSTKDIRFKIDRVRAWIDGLEIQPRQKRNKKA